MIYVPHELLEIAEQVKKGAQPSVTVRTLLSWFHAKRRTAWMVGSIRRALREVKLQTVPDFDWTYLDGPVTFAPKVEPAPDTLATPGTAVDTEVSTKVVSIAADAYLSPPVSPVTRGFGYPTYRIGRLASANKTPVSVPPDATIQEAITIMLARDFSQLPVMTSEREVKGLISWKSIGGRLSLGQPCEFVRECTDPHHEISADDSLFDVIDRIVLHECVLVRDSTKKICGIVTTSDLSVQFGQLGEPFFLLGEIENHIRGLIDGKFTQEELKAALDPEDPDRQIEDVSDLTFGEYLHLLEDPQKWGKLVLKIDRKVFIKDLDDIRRIRNDVMHFDPDGIGENDLATLRRFVQFLQRLRQLSPRKQEVILSKAAN
jgi:CBS domain-containing protein